MASAICRRKAGIPRRKGEMLDKMAISYPERPMCQSGKYQQTRPREVMTDQKMN